MPKGKPEQFLKIGDKVDNISAMTKPKEMHSVGGVLEQMPVGGVHLPGVRTKMSRRLAETLVRASHEPTVTSTENKETTENNQNNKGSMSIYITDFAESVKREIVHVSRQGSKHVFPSTQIGHFVKQPLLQSKVRSKICSMHGLKAWMLKKKRLVMHAPAHWLQCQGHLN